MKLMKTIDWDALFIELDPVLNTGVAVFLCPQCHKIAKVYDTKCKHCGKVAGYHELIVQSTKDYVKELITKHIENHEQNEKE